ncbi:MAG: ATP-dependent DNA helicase [Acidimicrobiales bacterium]
MGASDGGGGGSGVAMALARVTRALPGGGEARPGQLEMAEAVALAIEEKRALVVQAGTGTGKSLAYLVPALLSGRPTVVATATKALQDQLSGKDLPFLVEHLEQPFTFAVLKGRSNYVCRQRLAEVSGGDGQLVLDGLAERASAEDVGRIRTWAITSPTGDRAELDFEPSPTTWSAVSVSARECPGAQRCPQGEVCFAERARQDAAGADVVVVNTHLYSLDLECGGMILPEHDVVVIDEAHQLEDTVSATFGIELNAGRFQNLGRVVRGIVEDDDLVTGIDTSGSTLAAVLADHAGRRLRGPMEPEIAEVLTLARDRLERVRAALGAIDDERAGADVAARKQRAVKLTATVTMEIDAALHVPITSVAWVEGPGHNASLKVAPVDVAEVLREALWARRTAVLTSATIPPSLPVRLGLEPGSFVELDAGSPFDYEANAMLYCAAHLPDPRSTGYAAALYDELEALITAAGGRTLALFTSWRVMEAALDELRVRLPWPVLGQRDLPKPALVKAFAGDEHTSLFATMGFWQGIDVPGPSLSLVAIDRIPFPRPDEPLLQARRERARAEAFRLVDLPRAVTMLAQGAGRLVRTATDRGVVAVLDPRLASNARYRWDIVRALPPMHRTRDRDEAVRFLGSLHDDA